MNILPLGPDREITSLKIGVAEPMRTVITAALLLFVFSGVFLPENSSAASPTGWSPVVLPRGDYRQQIKAMPIEQRPGRLLHFYGNTIRMRDQAAGARVVRPVRQIFLGTTQLRDERVFAGR